MKVIPKNKLDQKLLDKLQNEIAIIQTVNHPNIVHCYDILQSSTRYYIIMDYIPDGDLLKYINTHSPSEQQIALLFIQIFSAVRYVHKLNIVHRDLKFENVLLDKDRIVISDFGLGHIADPEKTVQTATTMCGSSHYMAPEILSGHYDAQQADLFSLGVMLYVSVMKEFPFKGSNSFEIINNAQKFQYEKPKCSVELSNLIQAILKPVKQRATWDQIFHCKFFEKYATFINDNTLQIKNTNIQCKFVPTTEEFKMIEQKLVNVAKIQQIQETEHSTQFQCSFCQKDLFYLNNAEILNYKVKKAVSLNKFKFNPLDSLSVCTYGLQQVYPNEQLIVFPHKGRVMIQGVFECACYMANGKKIYARIGCQQAEDFTKFQQVLQNMDTSKSYLDIFQKCIVKCE